MDNVLKVHRSAKIHTFYPDRDIYVDIYIICTRMTLVVNERMPS